MQPKPHPSGKPKPKDRRGAVSIWNVPREDYLSPRLRRGQVSSAIGFTVNMLPGTDPEDLE